jgi:protein CLEC16A
MSIADMISAGNEAMACRVAFERGKEKEVFLVVASEGPHGALLLVEGFSNSRDGIVRVVAPLAGSRVRSLHLHLSFHMWRHVITLFPLLSFLA